MNDIAELRSHLFDTLRGLKDGSVNIDRAKAINETAQTIINSAKVEAEHLKIVGGQGTGFIKDASAQPGTLPPGITGITRHRLAG
jgi:hypothetical protein